MARTASKAGSRNGSEGSSSRVEEGRYRVPAAARVLSLIELMAEVSEPLGVSEMSRLSRIPKSSCFSLMATLEEMGYVRRNEHQEWTLTLRIHLVGQTAAANMDIHSASQAVLKGLCEDTALTAHLGVCDAGGISYALKVEPPGGMVKFDTYPGKPASAHLTAIGRAVSSAMDGAELDALLDGYEFSRGHNCRIRSRSGFLKELRAVRKRGYALELEEETADVACVAAPVSYSGGASAVGVAALAGQLDGKREAVIASVMSAAEALANLLGEREPEAKR